MYQTALQAPPPTRGRFNVLKGGRGVATEGHEGQRDAYAWVAGAVVEDPTLSPTAFRVYSLIRLHDYGRGSGCYLSRAEMSRRTGISERQIKRDLSTLREKGYITTSDTSQDGKSTNHHYCTDTGDSLAPGGDCVAPPTSIEAETGAVLPLGGGLCGPHGGLCGPPGGDCVAPKVDDTEVDELSRQATSHDVAASRDAREAQDGSEQRDEEAAPELGQGDGDPAAAAVLCGTLGIGATATNIRAMSNVIRDKAPQCHRALEDVALEAASWLDSHRKKGRSVAFFRNWVEREIAGPGSSSRGGHGHGHGETRGRSSADDRGDEAAAQRRQRADDAYLAKHLACGGTRASYDGL